MPDPGARSPMTARRAQRRSSVGTTLQTGGLTGRYQLQPADGKPSCPVWLLLLFAILIFASLGDRSLQGDETNIAIPALNILRCHAPTVNCGNMLVPPSEQQGFPVRQGIWVANSPAYDFITAPFLLAGRSTFLARLPFAIIGLLSLLLFSLYVSRFLKSTALLMAQLLFALNVMLLLYIRQARYYSIAVFAMLLLAEGYERFLAHQPSGTIMVAIAPVLLFHSSYTLAITALIGLMGAYLLDIAAIPSHRRRQHLIQAAVALVAFLLLSVPWALWANLLGNAGNVGVPMSFAHKLLVHSLQYLFDINNHLFPLLLLLLALLPVSSAIGPLPRRIKAVPIITILAAIIIMPAGTALFHHILFTLPFFAIISAVLVMRAGRLAWPLVILLVCSNLISALPVMAALPLQQRIGASFGSSSFSQFQDAAKPRMLLFDYAREITNPTTDKTEAVSLFLQANAQPHDIAALLDWRLKGPLLLTVDQCMYTPTGFRWNDTLALDMDKETVASTARSFTESSTLFANWVVSDTPLPLQGFVRHDVAYDDIGCGNFPSLRCRIMGPGTPSTVIVYERLNKVGASGSCPVEQ
ncbi:hypothetical protein COY28_05275 [Candidatus Woesearchaeota archaeon CG_4_10_14_0_2_um_filter_57_5]|nr:MAG: hypothetical protein AUJ68_06355 [Candidatus Woesearchaeota archaeon CG1_02_57_44]PIN68420.1 MAG: hypothetical protein COV94_04745 [Candidatus Woesearchaeota archaeon CG11_big_fil_rev_8_21_14_0_20_57_5]PIZ50928.1 MAG: hypothetical protein COY28_05275 [Candidatus Woesearchaeota archaeon CG_4_10_14_0_2_um_filter_57_5]